MLVYFWKFWEKMICHYLFFNIYFLLNIFGFKILYTVTFALWYTALWVLKNCANSCSHHHRHGTQSIHHLKTYSGCPYIFTYFPLLVPCIQWPGLCHYIFAFSRMSYTEYMHLRLILIDICFNSSFFFIVIIKFFYCCYRWTI